MTQKALVPKVPALKSGRDSKEVAQILDSLISDAEEGLRRVIYVGLFILTITEDLPHGRFGPWLEEYLPHRSRMTVWRWKQLAMNVLEIAGLRLADCDFVQMYHVLQMEEGKSPTLSLLQLPPEVEAKINQVIEGKTQKQLFFEFKNALELPTEDGEVEVIVSCEQGGDLTPRDEKGRRIAAERRTKEQIEREAFESESSTRLLVFQRGLDLLMGVKAPDGIARAWDVLNDKDLEALKLQVGDLREGMLASQARRRPIGGSRK